MYLELKTKAKSGYPYLTLKSILDLASEDTEFSTFTLTCSPCECAKLKLQIDQNREQYVSMVKSAKDRSEIEELWSRKMLDLEYVESPISIYPEALDLTLIKIRVCQLDLITSLIEIFKAAGVELEYINKSSDSVIVSKDMAFCTKRMAKYFPSLLVKIPRSEYRRLRGINKWLAIKSGNFYYKNKNCNL